MSTNKSDYKAEILREVSEWIDRAIDGDAELISIHVVDRRGEEITFNICEGILDENEEVLTDLARN